MALQLLLKFLPFLDRFHNHNAHSTSIALEEPFEFLGQFTACFCQHSGLSGLSVARLHFKQKLPSTSKSVGIPVSKLIVDASPLFQSLFHQFCYDVKYKHLGLMNRACS